jgi:hypothetical protein
VSDAFALSVVVLWVVTILLFLIVVGLVRTVYDLRRQLAVVVGEPRRAPHFRAPTLDGGVIDTQSINDGPYALIFVTPDCATCRLAVTQLGPVRRRAGDRIVILCNGDPQRARSLASQVEPGVTFALDEGGAVGKAFGVTTTPMTIVVDAEGQIRSMGSILGDEPPTPDGDPGLVVAANTPSADGARPDHGRARP